MASFPSCRGAAASLAGLDVSESLEFYDPISASFVFSKLSDLRLPRGARGGLSRDPRGASFFRGAKGGFLPIGPSGACNNIK